MTFSDVEWDVELARTTINIALEKITAGAIKGVEVAALNIEADVRRTSPIDQGTYRNSIHTNPPIITDNTVTVEIGSAMPYACRLEWGFYDIDSLGRMYSQDARPHWRPAFDNNADNTSLIIAREIRREQGDGNEW